MNDDSEPNQMRVRARAGRVRRRRRLRRRGDLRRLLHRSPRHPLRPGPLARADHAFRRRAEAAGARGAAPRAGRRAAAGRAGQLPRRARPSDGWRPSWSRTPKSVLLVSHDRELLDQAARPSRSSSWAPPATRSGCTAAASPRLAEARRERFARFEELRRRWDEEHTKLKDLVQMYKIKAAYNDGMASRYQAAKTRLAKFEEAGPPRGRAAGAEGVDAAERRPDRQAGGRRRRPGADRADAAVRHRDLVRRPRCRAGLQRVGQVALPAPAGPRRLRS